MDVLLILSGLILVSSSVGLNAFIGYLIYVELKKERVIKYEDLPIPTIPQEAKRDDTLDNDSEYVPLDEFTPDFTKPLNVKMNTEESTLDMEEPNGQIN